MLNLIGSTNLLGNPRKFAKTIKSGINHIKEGEGFSGKTKGSVIFVKNSLEGVCGVFQAFTGSISKLALLGSFDAYYLREREEKLMTTKP